MTTRSSTRREGGKWRRFRNAYKARCQAANLPCWRCGRTIDYHAPANHEAAFEADHAIPVGGPNGRAELMYVESNLRPCCCKCNRQANTPTPPSKPWPPPSGFGRWVKPDWPPADSELAAGLRFWAERRRRGLLTPGEAVAEAEAKRLQAERAERRLQ